jgi:hypothetical protein
MRGPRRLASLLVLVVAGLASLATTQILHADATLDGRSVVGPGETVLAVAISLSGVGSNGYEYEGSQSHLQFQVRGEPGTRPIGAAGAVEVQIVGSSGELQPAAWTTASATVPLVLDGCQTSCVLDFAVHLRAGRPDNVPLVVPWRIYAIAVGDVSRLVIDVDAASEGPLLTDLAIWSTLLGLALGLIAAVFIAVLGRRRSQSASAILEATAAIALIVGGALVAQGLLVDLESGVAGFVELAAGIAVGAGLANGRPLLSRPSMWLVPISVALPPLILARFVIGAEFRIPDVIAAFLVAGVALAITVILIVPRVPARLARLKLLQPRTLLVTAIALAGAGIAAVWAVLIAAGATRVSVGAWAPLEFIYMALLIGLWRWLHGDSVTPFIGGFAVAVAAFASAFIIVMSLFANLYVPGPASPLLLESIAAIGLSGVLFGLLTIKPPRRKDPTAPKGRAFQSGWEEGEVSQSRFVRSGPTERLFQIIVVGVVVLVGIVGLVGILVFLA